MWLAEPYAHGGEDAQSHKPPDIGTLFRTPSANCDAEVTLPLTMGIAN